MSSPSLKLGLRLRLRHDKGHLFMLGHVSVSVSVVSLDEERRQEGDEGGEEQVANLRHVDLRARGNNLNDSAAIGDDRSGKSGQV